MKIQGTDFTSTFFARKGFDFTKEYVIKHKALFGWQRKTDEELTELATKIYETCMEENGTPIVKEVKSEEVIKTDAPKKQGGKK